MRFSKGKVNVRTKQAIHNIRFEERFCATTKEADDLVVGTPSTDEKRRAFPGLRLVEWGKDIAS